MRTPPSRIGAFAPLAVGAALAGHTGADAGTTDLGKMRMVGPDPISAATAEDARAQGRLLLAANNVPQALQAYRQALALDPESVEALNGVAVCYDRLGRYQDSRLHYEAALGIDPTSPMLLNNYGLSLHLQGEHAEAVRFLRLAAAAGDLQVQEASLRLLARIEAVRGRASAQPPGEAAEAHAAPGPRVVRTSGHELRLVLDSPRTPSRQQPVSEAAVQMAAASRPAEEAVAIAAVGNLTAREEAGIARAEAHAIAAEYAAAARAEAQARADARAELLAASAREAPAEMQVAAVLATARADATSLSDDQASPFRPAPSDSFAPSPAAPDWHRDQILLMAPSSSRPDGGGFNRASLRMALLAAGLSPPRPAQRAMLAAAARAALDPEPPRRAFGQPFESDNGRLNSLAERIHGQPAEPDVSEQIARLEALIAQVRRA